MIFRLEEMRSIASCDVLLKRQSSVRKVVEEICDMGVGSFMVIVSAGMASVMMTKSEVCVDIL